MRHAGTLGAKNDPNAWRYSGVCVVSDALNQRLCCHPLKQA